MKRYKILTLLLACIMLVCVISGCRDEQEKVLFTVGGYPVTVEEYTYFYYNFKSSLSAYGQDTQEEIHENVLQALREKYALKTMADEHKITLTDEEKTALDTQYNEYVTYYGGQEAFAAAMAENYLTERYFRQMLEAQKLEEKVRAYICDDYTGDIPGDYATVEADVRENFIRASQVVILHEAGDDLIKNYETAQKVAEQAKNGVDFEQLVKSYNEDTYMDAHDGYYFTHGQMLQIFEDTAWSLEIGEVSEVVTSDLGYHVIKRLPLEDNYIKEHFEELREAYRARVFNTRTEELAATLEIRYYDRFYEWTPA